MRTRMIIAGVLLTSGAALAAPLVEYEATPSVLSEPEAVLLITEVSFKNKEADWVTMRYESPSGKPIDLKGMAFGDDKIFKSIDETMVIASGQDLLLTFKNDDPDAMPYLHTSQSGLTGTTEQFIIYDRDGSVLDAVCWTSSTPTASEISDLLELYEQEGWHSPDINSCLPSENVPANESIQRSGMMDTNSAVDWMEQQAVPTQTLSLTKPQSSVEEAGEPEEPSAVPLESPLPAPPVAEMEAPGKEALTAPKKVEITTPVVTTKTKTATKTASKKNTRNGGLSENVVISEILPNPEGNDSKKEWVELLNTGKEAVNLGNWQLDDEEGGSKPYGLSHTLIIEAGGVVLIQSGDSKLSLGNGEDAVRLLDFEGRLMDEVAYSEAPSGQSYSRITIINEDGTRTDEWLWTGQPTPGERNADLESFTAEITDGPVFEGEYSFKVINAKGVSKAVIFDEGLIAAPLAQATFLPGSTLRIIAEPMEEGTYILKKFELLSAPAPESPLGGFLLPSLVGTLIIVAAAAFFLVHKKIPWQENKPSV